MTLRLVIALLLLIGGAPGAHTQELANPMCPVMTWEPASAEIQVTFGEKPVYFCCDDCKEDFLAEPGKYLAALPQFEGVDHQRLLAAHRGRDLLGGMRPLLWGLAALMAVVLVVRLRRLRSAGGAKGA